MGEVLLFFFGILMVLILGSGMRGFVATARLQKCIDNGSAEFDGVSVEPSPTLKSEVKEKVLRERRIYLSIARAFPGSLKLYKRNSDV